MAGKDGFFDFFLIPYGFLPERCFLFPKCFSFPETNVFRFQCAVLFLLFRLGTFPKSRGIYLSQPVAAVATKTCHTTHLEATAFKVRNPHIAIQTLTSRFQSIISGMRKNAQSIVLWVYAFPFLRLSNSLPPWLLAGLHDSLIGGGALLAFCAEATISILLDLPERLVMNRATQSQPNPQAKQIKKKLKSLSRGFYC